jgi:hypothetical protein
MRGKVPATDWKLTLLLMVFIVVLALFISYFVTAIADVYSMVSSLLP